MKKGLRHTTTIILIIFILGVILFPKIKPFIVSKLKKQTVMGGPIRQPQQKLNATGFIIVPAQLSELRNSTGTLRPDEEVDLSFETSGKIVKINFTEGTKVRKGDLLAKMNDLPLQAQLEKLLAQRKLTEEKEYRQKSLLTKDAISQESYDQIVTELQTNAADINLIRARILETELKAPFDGIIGLRYLSEGSYATSSTKIAKLIKISPLKIEFSIPEKYAYQVNIGYPVTFKIAASDEVYKASIYAVDPKIDIFTRVITLRALYPNKNEELKAGSFATITLKLSQIEDAIAIPTEALIPEMEGEKVFIYKSGKASTVKVTVGLRTESRIQITSGLKFGDTLITSGIMQLRQNLPILLDTVILNK